MDVASFYGIVSGLSFTLLGLWFVVADRHKEWFRVPVRRRMAYVVSLHFMLPGTMSVLSLVAPDIPAVWRIVFALCGIAGIVGSVLIAEAVRAEYGRARLAALVMFVALPVYIFIVVFALAPSASGLIGLQPRQAEAILIAGILLLGLHAAWFLTTQPAPAPEREEAKTEAA
jgi:MFS family permease